MEQIDFLVPNVPCGVESQPILGLGRAFTNSVPNVPCGVESQAGAFLNSWQGCVPNVPCGVESLYKEKNSLPHKTFLMYRVELKEHTKAWNSFHFFHGFLMYRVELKA